MTDQIVPPNSQTMPPLPPGWTRFTATCTAVDGTQAVLSIDALNHLGAISFALSWMCNFPVVIKKFVLEPAAGPVLHAAPKLYRG